MTDTVIYDITVYGDGEFIDEFVSTGDPPPDFSPENWVAGYKRYFPQIAKCYGTISIKYKMREMK